MIHPTRRPTRRVSAVAVLAGTTTLPLAVAAAVTVVVATAPSAEAGPGGAPGGVVSTDFTLRDSAGSGFTDVTYSTTIVSEPSRTTDHYFWADQISFTGGQVASIGLQPRPDSGGSSQGAAYFSVFGSGTTTSDPHCSQGADGGAGLSCSVSFAYQVGHTYHLNITSTGTNAGTSTWTGSVADVAGGPATHIATWTVPSAWGNIGPRSVAFTEFYASLPRGCDDLPYALVVNGAPSAQHGTIQGSVTGASTYGGTSGSYADCSAASFARAWTDSAGSHSETGLVQKPGGPGAGSTPSLPGITSRVGSTVQSSPRKGGATTSSSLSTLAPSAKTSTAPTRSSTQTKTPVPSASNPASPPAASATQTSVSAAMLAGAGTTSAELGSGPSPTSAGAAGAVKAAAMPDGGERAMMLPIFLGAGSAALVGGWYWARRHRTPRSRPGGTRRKVA